MLVAYAAKGGTEADDGLPGGNSPFTEAFLRHAGAAGLDVRIMLGRVRDDVVRKTSRQEPFTYGSLGGDTISLNPAQGGPTAPQWRRSSTETSDAAQSWVIAKDSTSEAVLEAFMEKYKSDPFYHALARDRLAAVRREGVERQRLAMLQKGEEEKRKRAEDEAKKKAEDEARRKAEEEAQKRDSALAATSGSSQSIAQAPSKQIRLTEKQIESFIGAHKRIEAILNKTPELALDKLDAKTKAEIEGVAKQHGFRDFAEYDDVGFTIGLVLIGIDPQTKVFADPLLAIQKEIEAVRADKTIADAEKKSVLAELNEAIKTTAPIQHPSNIELIKKHYDKLDALLQ